MIKNIVINDKNYFLLTNKLLGLVLKIEYGKVEVIHFGADVSELDIPALDNPLYIEYGNSILYDQNDKNSCLNCLPLAFSERGIGDYRETGISLSLDNSNLTGDFVFDSFNIFNGTKTFDTPMPDARSDDKVETLELILKSKFDNDILVKLYFSLFETCLTRRSVIVNNSDKNITLNKLVSSLFDLKGDFDMITLDGGWIAEGSLNRTQVLRSNVVNKSTVGFSSNFHNPGFLLVRKDISEDYGFGYGFNIIYSGNHYSQAQKSLQNLTRVIQSMNFEDFKLKLNKGSEFVTPVAVCTYSRRGLNGISRNMHKFINNHIIPPQFKDADRPIVYNSWEGCGFDFNEGRLVRLAKESKEIGCELFVLDDGWFGERNNDEAGLGDYNVNKKKLPNGLKGLADKINKIGMKFGLWFEPESVNPNSNLYREHPDWAIHLDNLEDLYGRNQLLLDLRKEEVRDYIVSSVGKVLDSANIEYVKWDMNRQSSLRGRDAHDYIIGLYDCLHRIFDSRPNILLESCSSGGNRFDLGMMYFSPQIWTSDDTDPVERVRIQNGMSSLYPLSVISNHVSLAPHAQTLRYTPMSTRCNVSFFGTFGVEMELKFLVNVEKNELKENIEFYKKYRHTFTYGEFYKYNHDNETVWVVKEPDDSKAIVMMYKEVTHASSGLEWLKIHNLDQKAFYNITTKEQYLRVADFGSLINYITPVTLNPNGLIVKTVDARYKMKDATLHYGVTGKGLREGITLPTRFIGTGYSDKLRVQGDYSSNVFVFEKEEKE